MAAPYPPDHPAKFTPVPRSRSRKDGWTADRQQAFVQALARLPSVTAAARSVGMSARSAYRLRAAIGAEAFAAAWDDALEIGIDAARDAAIDRATIGVLVPVVHRGRVVGVRRRFQDRLLSAALGSAAMEHKGLLAHARRIQDRRAVRDADARHGGPLGADAVAVRLAAEAEAAATERAGAVPSVTVEAPPPRRPPLAVSRL